jgi:hypothetical protein
VTEADRVRLIEMVGRAAEAAVEVEAAAAMTGAAFGVQEVRRLLDAAWMGLAEMGDVLAGERVARRAADLLERTTSLSGRRR